MRGDYAALGEAVVAERERRGWTQERLAGEAVVTRAALSNLETGKTKSPRRATVMKVAKALGWSESQVDRILRDGETERAEEAGPVPLGLRAMARRMLPRAPGEVVDRYARLVDKAARLTSEAAEIEARYGGSQPPSERSSSRPPTGEFGS